jgi:uncharacterized protein (DUF1786 family)
MGLFLMIDIGAGTMDILCFDVRSGDHFKAVAPSPVRHVAEKAAATRGPLAVTGVEMGGGPITTVLQARAKQAKVVICESAAASLHHDADRVRAWGLEVIDDDGIEAFLTDPAYTPITLGDVEPARIERIITGLGFAMDFDVVALCAQDHGVAPKGVSHLDFRHNLYQQYLDQNPRPEKLLFTGDQVPAAFNRLRCMAASAKALNAREIYVMDSGMAAILGASEDMQADPAQPVAVLDIATSHTVGAIVEGNDVAGFFEYHTKDITLEKLESLLIDLAEGRISHARVLSEGGHGAYLRRVVGYDNLCAIIATGPKRRLVDGSRLPICWGAPWGDNMMTGTVGLLEAVRRKKGMAPIRYI